MFSRFRSRLARFSAISSSGRGAINFVTGHASPFSIRHDVDRSPTNFSRTRESAKPSLHRYPRQGGLGLDERLDFQKFPLLYVFTRSLTIRRRRRKRLRIHDRGSRLLINGCACLRIRSGNFKKKNTLEPSTATSTPSLRFSDKD